MIGSVTLTGDVAIPRQLLAEEQIAAISERFVVIVQTRQRDRRHAMVIITIISIDNIGPGCLLTTAVPAQRIPGNARLAYAATLYGEWSPV